DGRAVERRVELVLVHPEPPPQRLAGAAAPGPPLLAFDHAGRLAEHIRELAGVPGRDGQRLERVAGLDAGAATTQVALERRERAVRRLPDRHADLEYARWSSRSRRCRTSRRDATGARSTRSARRSPSTLGSSTCTPIPTTTARCSRSSRSRSRSW